MRIPVERQRRGRGGQVPEQLTASAGSAAVHGGGSGFPELGRDSQARLAVGASGL
jgi:hypothetical protein